MGLVKTDTDKDGLADANEVPWCTSETDPDSDDDGLCDGDTQVLAGATVVCQKGEDLDRDGIVDPAETNPCLADTDGDGLSDGAEKLTYYTDPRLTDTDGDGEGDYLEAVTRPCLNELVADTDSDGLNDGAEDADHDGILDPSESDPCAADSDGDGLNDYSEVITWLTNPRSPDTDGDGVGDFVEAITRPCLNELAADSDGDGLGDGAEDADHDGALDPGETDPCLADTDADGLSDYAEVITYLTNPRAADTDADGENDLLEALTKPCLNELAPDTDSDGLNDGAEDADHDGILDANETEPCLADTDGDGLSDGLEVNTHFTNPRSWDTDGDALPDAYEVAHRRFQSGAQPAQPGRRGAPLSTRDANPNRHEYWNGSDPWFANPVGAAGCFYWGDAGAGDGFVSPADAIEFKKVIIGDAGQLFRSDSRRTARPRTWTWTASSRPPTTSSSRK